MKKIDFSHKMRYNILYHAKKGVETMQDFTTVKMDRDIHELAKAYCKENGMTLSGLVRKLLLQYLRAEANPVQKEA